MAHGLRRNSRVKTRKLLDRGGDQVVSVDAFYSDDPSSNPAEVFSFYSVNCLKR